MSRRGLVLGNSHVACLREAWRQAAVPGIELDFLAAHAERMDGLAFEGRRAFAGTGELRDTLDRLGMRTSFRLDEYDFFVVSACQIGIFRAVEAARAMAVWTEARDARTLVSGACFRDALADALRATTAARLVDGLAGAGVPILVLPQPHPREAVLQADSRFAGFRQIDGAGRGAWLHGMFRAACERAVAGMAQVLHQPERTLAREICTSAAFSGGSIMLAAGRREHGAADVLHANADYGGLQLQQIIAAVADGAWSSSPAAPPGQTGATCRVGVLG